MKPSRLIKKIPLWHITLSLCLLLFVGMLVLKLWPRTLPVSQCSEVYQRYAGVEGLDVSYIKDFRVNDSLFVDVTLLEAKDTTAWSMLKHDFRVVAPKEIDTSVVTFWFAPRNNYLNQTDPVLKNNDIIVMHYYRQTIAVIGIESESQIEGIFTYHILNLRKKN